MEIKRDKSHSKLHEGICALVCVSFLLIRLNSFHWFINEYIHTTNFTKLHTATFRPFAAQHGVWSSSTAYKTNIILRMYITIHFITLPNEKTKVLIWCSDLIKAIWIKCIIPYFTRLSNQSTYLKAAHTCHSLGASRFQPDVDLNQHNLLCFAGITKKM